MQPLNKDWMENADRIKFEGIERTLAQAGIEGPTQSAILKRVIGVVISLNEHMRGFYRDQAAGKLEESPLIARCLSILKDSPNKWEFEANLVDTVKLRHDDPAVEILDCTASSPYIALQIVLFSARIIDASTTAHHGLNEVPVKTKIVFAPESQNEFKTATGEVIEFETHKREDEALSERELVGILSRSYEAGLQIRTSAISRTKIPLREGEDATEIVIPENLYRRIEKKLSSSTETFLPTMRMAFIRGRSATLETLINTVMSHAIQRR